MPRQLPVRLRRRLDEDAVARLRGDEEQVAHEEDLAVAVPARLPPALAGRQVVLFLSGVSGVRPWGRTG